MIRKARKQVGGTRLKVGGLAVAASTLAVVLSACGAIGPGSKGGGDLPPPPTREASGPPTATPDGVEVAEETTQAQLETFRFVWNQINMNYAYADHNGVDWREIRGIYQTQVENGMTDEMFHEALAAMISELGDESTIYLTPEEVREQAGGDTSGETEEGYVGTLVGMPDGTRERMTILYVFPGSPAEEAGVLPHDIIVGIEGERVPVDPGPDMLEQIRGEVGTEVSLTVQAPGDAPREVRVGRAPLDGAGEIEVGTLEGNIGYVFLPPGTDEASLGVRVTNAVRSLLEDEGIEALILDLRIARVGQAWPVDELLGLFVHGDAYELFNASEQLTQSVTGRDVAGSQELPLVVLVGYDTAGTSEILAGALQSLGRATVVGGQSSGEAELVLSMPVGEEAVLLMTAASMRSLDGNVWGRAGVAPDVVVDLRWEEFAPDNDAQLEAAIEEAQALMQ